MTKEQLFISAIISEMLIYLRAQIEDEGLEHDYQAYVDKLIAASMRKANCSIEMLQHYLDYRKQTKMGCDDEKSQVQDEQ